MKKKNNSSNFLKNGNSCPRKLSLHISRRITYFVMNLASFHLCACVWCVWCVYYLYIWWNQWAVARVTKAFPFSCEWLLPAGKHTAKPSPSVCVLSSFTLSISPHQWMVLYMCVCWIYFFLFHFFYFLLSFSPSFLPYDVCTRYGVCVCLCIVYAVAVFAKQTPHYD